MCSFDCYSLVSNVAYISCQCGHLWWRFWSVYIGLVTELGIRPPSLVTTSFISLISENEQCTV